MKKYLLGLMAIVFAVAGSAFTHTDDAGSSSLYWFRYDDMQQQFVYDRHDVTPSITCDGLGEVCAQGFEQPNTNGETVYPGVNLIDEKEKN